MENSTPEKSSLIKSGSSVKLGAFNGLWSLLILGGTLFALNTQLDIPSTINKFKVSFLQQAPDTGISVRILADLIDSNETDAGTQNFIFELQRIGGDGSSPLTIGYKVTGTGDFPASPADFVGGVFPSGTVMFPAGAPFQSRLLFIPVKGETLFEQDEQFTVTLCNPIPGGDTVRLDPDEFSASARIENDDFCELSPSTLSTNTDSLCIGEDIDLSAEGAEGGTETFILSDQNGILYPGASFSTIEQVESYISDANAGIYCLYSVVYDEQLACIGIPSNLADFSDCFTSCFVLSSPLCFTVDSFCQFTATVINVVPSACTGPTGSFTVNVQNGALCQGTYNVGATPIAGTGPGGTNPPTTNTTLYIGFSAREFLFANAGAGKYAISVTETSGCGGPVNPILDTVCILQDLPHSAIRLIGSDTLCEGGGDTIKIEFSASGGTGPYDFEYNDVILNRISCIPGGVGGTYIVLNDTVVTLCFIGLGPGTYSWTLDRVTDNVACVDDTNRTVTVIILPKPKGTDDTKMIESCINVDYNLIANLECNLPSTFSWYAVQSIGSNTPYDNPNVTGETVSPPGTDTIIDDLLINISKVDQTIHYYVLPTSLDGCVGDSFYISVTVKPAIINLVAHDQVNISMDENCMKVVTAADVVKNAGSCGDLLTEVIIAYPFGTQTYSPANKLDRSHLGYCMVFSVKDLLTGNTTWGKLCVEDKKGPELACEADTVTCFEIAQLPQGSYTVKDNCSDLETKVLVASEQFIDYGCEGEGVDLMNTFPQWDGKFHVSPFGVPLTSTYGQTFDITGSATPIHSITIQIRCTTPNVTFRGHIYAWDGSKATGPSLFDGPMQMAASVANVFMPATINTAGLTLPIATYVFFISTSEDVQPNIRCDLGLVSNNAIPNGQFVFLNNGNNSASWTADPWTLFSFDLAIQIKMSSNIQGKLIRHLIATDPWGNTAECDKEYVIQKIELDSIVCPRDTGVDCSLEFVTIKDNKVSFKDPLRSGYPKIKTRNGLISLWPNNAACKLTLSPPIDEYYPICGAGYKIRRTWRITDWCTGAEKLCVQWIEVVDKTAPVATDKILPVVYSDPHQCGNYVNLDTLANTDCSKVSQTYLLKYKLEGKDIAINGKLPATRVWLPVGTHNLSVVLLDACGNSSKRNLRVQLKDNTPPIPVCDEFTQVTVDPATCWAAIAAKDLDNGSRDNCCEELHFAAAYMDSITYWRDYWNKKLETEVGKAAFWKDKVLYDAMIENWINCYVFSDTVHFDECGTNQIVLRVYEACGMAKYDPHVFPCSPHAWFCYNNYYTYLSEFNWNWQNSKGNKSCEFRMPLVSIDSTFALFLYYFDNGYSSPRFNAKPQSHCLGNFSGNISRNEVILENIICRDRLYSDCMVNVLVDDKQAPVAYGLKDITIYCDGAPEWSKYKYCGDDADRYRSSTWPGELKDKKGVIHGYYGGSDFLGVHVNEDDHADPQACRESHGWAPIYCKDWLYLDSFDQAGHQDYASYFDKLLMFDKKTKQSTDLKENEFSITDNCLLDKTSLKVSNAGTINGCGEGWISRTWTMKDKCGNEVTATQKIYVKHRSDFEVIFPADKVVTCDFFNRTDTTTRGAGAPSISDDECEQIGVQYRDEIFTIEEDACYKIVRTWTMIDWCIYDPNQHYHQPDVIVNDTFRANKTDRSCVFRSIKDNGDGYMQYVQIIKVIDEIAPRFTCSDNTTCITAGCDAKVNLPVSASDNCSNANDIRIRAEITKPDNTVDRRSNITAITGTFTEGIYQVKMVANDKCGNETACNMTITVKDCKKPTPYCIDGLATVIMPTPGTVEIWAKDFNIASEDNCTAKERLRYSFGPDVTKPNRVITCADIPNGREALLVVDIYVHDLADNKDLCRVSLKVQDNNSAETPGGACRDTTAALTTITNRLSSQNQVGVQKVPGADVNALNQNYPNPFSSRTVISVSLAQPVDGTLNITDVQGRLVKSIKRNWTKGYNEVIIEKTEMKSSGIFYYSFESAIFTASKRMIILE